MPVQIHAFKQKRTFELGLFCRASKLITAIASNVIGRMDASESPADAGWHPAREKHCITALCSGNR